MAPNKKQQAVIDQMTRRAELCHEFMQDWLIFNQVLSAYPSPGVNKALLENQFLKIKSKLARAHKVLRDTLQEDYQIDQNAMNIVSGATNLESIYSQSDVAVKKLQAEWHRAFISINETLGTLEDKKARAEAGEKIFVMAAGGVGGGGGGGDPKKMTTLFIVLGVAALIGALLFFNVGGIGDMYRSALGSPPKTLQ